jgi:hypothetical protein
MTSRSTSEGCREEGERDEDACPLASTLPGGQSLSQDGDGDSQACGVAKTPSSSSITALY